MSGRKIYGPDGGELDAEFGVEIGSAGEISVVLESRGGTRGEPGARNVDYAAGLRALLTRLAAQHARISDAFVDSQATRTRPIEERRLQGHGLAYPIDIHDADDLRTRLGAAQADVGRAPDATGAGNRTKRLRLILEFAGAPPTQDNLEGQLAGRGSAARAENGASADQSSPTAHELATSTQFGVPGQPSADAGMPMATQDGSQLTPFTSVQEEQVFDVADGLGEPQYTVRLNSRRRKRALDVLRADRLRELARDFELSVGSYRERDDMIAALADGRRVDFRSVLDKLTRDELKCMCVTLGLEMSGKDKESLVDRLVEGDQPRAERTPREASAPSIDGVARNLHTGGSFRRRKRDALATLKADRLRELVRRFGLDVDSYRDRDGLITALADGRRLDFAEVLAELTRGELKAICEVVGVAGTSHKDKSGLVELLLGESDDPADESPPSLDDDDDDEPPTESAPDALARLCADSLTVQEHGRGWPMIGSIQLSTDRVPASIYVRSIGRSGRARPTERRFQNPAGRSRAIRLAPDGVALLLLGVWTEQGEDRAVIVAMDAYRRIDHDTRTSLFMPLSLLETAADTGSAEHRSHSGETIFAFRPSQLPFCVERMLVEAGLRKRSSLPPRLPSPTIAIAPPTPPARAEEEVADGHIHIRPKVGMYAAFARLNYKPWFAIAEFLDNAIQSHLAVATATSEPLLIDVRLDDNEIVVADRAEGIALRDFPRAFSPSQPPPDARGLSEFGLGMKAAACWFAKRWSVRTSARGEGVERTIAFDVPRITQEGIEALPISETTVPADVHYTVVTLSDLLVRPKGRTIAKIRDHLASIYRVLVQKRAVRIRLSTGRASEELVYTPPRLLVAPHFREPEGTPREWRHEFEFSVGDGRRVWGWAGLLETGSVSHAGFSVFRRDRLIQGSADEPYRPVELCRKPNSYTYQRLTGEIFVDGFDVSHTKDGIQWDGLEEAVISRLRMDLSSQSAQILQQAEGYRARRKATDLEPGFGLAAVASTGAVLTSDSLGEALAQQLRELPEEQAEAREQKGLETPAERTLTKRTFTVDLPNTQLPWCVTIELVSDRSREWFERGSATRVEERAVHVLVNLAHPFSEQFINDSEVTLDALLRVVCGLALAEETARESGVKFAGTIRTNLNKLLREALGSRAREHDE